MEKKNIGVKVLVIVLSVLVVALLGYIVYDKMSNEDADNSLNDIASTEQDIVTDEISGVYESVVDIKINGKTESCNIILYLWENGIFKYEISTPYTPSGAIGNFVVKGDKIILNNLFITGSDVSLHVTKGINKLTIQNNHSIYGSFNYNDEKFNVTLIKNTSTNNAIYNNENYIYNIMNGSYFVNATNSN